MDGQPTKPARKMTGVMPLTAEWVDRQRQELGTDYVDALIKRGMRGEAGCFYAMENGHFLGAPFPANHPIAEYQNLAVMIGAKFAAFIQTPKEST